MRRRCGLLLLLVVLAHERPLCSAATTKKSKSKTKKKDGLDDVVPEKKYDPHKSCFPFPPIIIGTWKIFERYEEPFTVLEYLEEFVRANFTMFDTADIYGYSEDMLGKLRERNPRVKILTKYVTQDSSFMAARGITHLSRQKLGMETLDMVQLHWWHFADARHVQTMTNLRSLQEEGAVEFLGVTNFDCFHLRQIVRRTQPTIKIVTNQVQYSLLDRRPENGMIQFAKEHGIQLLCYGAVAGGLLSDTFLGLQPEQGVDLLTTASRHLYWTSLRKFTDDKWAVYQQLLQTLRAVADDLYASSSSFPGGGGGGDPDDGKKKKKPNVATVAIAWVLDRLSLTGVGGSVILGVRDSAHLDDAVLARDLRLHQSHRDMIDRALRQGEQPYGDIWERERMSGTYK